MPRLSRCLIVVQESDLSKIHDTPTGRQSFYTTKYSSGEGFKVLTAGKTPMLPLTDCTAAQEREVRVR